MASYKQMMTPLRHLFTFSVDMVGGMELPGEGQNSQGTPYGKQ